MFLFWFFISRIELSRGLLQAKKDEIGICDPLCVVCFVFVQSMSHLFGSSELGCNDFYFLNIINVCAKKSGINEVSASQILIKSAKGENIFPNSTHFSGI